ncbi:MAG: ABC transporter substrate-binding protein [Pseudobutyrivibrio sp.]|nr:ABC transporter substrate-binding protein [Pseudobutyrivibrio sp.]
MKKGIILAAAIAIVLTGCSYLNNKELNSGTYSCQVQMEGGSGRASIQSPAQVTVEEDAKTVELVWSSSHYDYMIVEGTQYDNEAELNENSVFTIPFEEFDQAFEVIADTTAMGTPHEITYEITVSSPENSSDDTSSNSEQTAASREYTNYPPEYSLGNLQYVSFLQNNYAREFKVDFYKGNKYYALITLGTGSNSQYFLKEIDDEYILDNYCLNADSNNTDPLEEEHDDDYYLDGISDNVTILSDIGNTYLVSTSVMDYIVAIDALSNIKFSGTKASDWSIPEATKSIKSGDILYAGKYSAPDYELLLEEGCNLAIENTMIYHNPEVKEKLEALGIPVMVEYSSYETNPLGRLEWIKLYGLLYDQLENANSIFDEQVEVVNSIDSQEDTGLKVAVFSVSTNGTIIVRSPQDYVATMIDMAGGNYVPEDLKHASDGATSTATITVEDFYLIAEDADVLIYNGIIEGEISNKSVLLNKAPLLKDFKAFKNDRVYCLPDKFFQQSTHVADFIEDLHGILVGETSSLKYLYKIED